MAVAAMLQRARTIRASPLLGFSYSRFIATVVASGQFQEIIPSHLVCNSVALSHVRHYRGTREDYSRFEQPTTPTNWGIRIVPENKVFVVERFGKFSKTLGSGIHLLIPTPSVLLTGESAVVQQLRQ